MKATTFIFLLPLLSLATMLQAQQGFFQTLEANGSDTLYTEYWGPYDNEKDGTYKFDNRRYNSKITVTTKETGEKVGVECIDAIGEKHNRVFYSNIETGYDIMYGYPETYMLCHKYDRKAQLIIGDYFIILKGINPDKLTYTGIDKILVRQSSKGAPKTEEKKKKKRRGFLKALKSAIISTGNSSVSELESINWDEKISSYLKAMKQKDEAHKKTPEQDEAYRHLVGLKAKHDQYIRDYNNQYTRKPEHHKVMQNKATGEMAADSERHTRLYGDDSRVKNCKYFLHNTGTTDFNYVISGNRPGVIKAGEKVEFSCYRLTFFAEGKDKGVRIAGGGMSWGGKVIKVNK